MIIPINQSKLLASHFQVWLWLEVFGSFAGGRYRSRYQGRKYQRRYRPRHQHYYLQPSYERVSVSRYVPDYEDDVVFRSVGRSSSRPVLALSGGLGGVGGVGYIANSGGALHVVG